MVRSHSIRQNVLVVPAANIAVQMVSTMQARDPIIGKTSVVEIECTMVE
jgi:hypothetical protein